MLGHKLVITDDWRLRCERCGHVLEKHTERAPAGEPVGAESCDSGSVYGSLGDGGQTGEIQTKVEC